MEIKDYEENMVPYVWYAAYGSNLNSARFQRYLDHCGGDVATIESRPHTMNGTIYFAADSNTWGRGKGVAFYDENGQGSVLARVYKVSRSQFIAICDMEGSKYSRTLRLGTIDGAPVYTCTSPQKREDVHAPSTGYVKTILDGLKETYPDLSENMLLSYLFRHGAISEEAREVLAYIRRAPHAVTIREMAESGVCSGIARTEEEVKYLSGLGLIKQDARSIRAGHRSGDPEAMYFTAPEKRDIADLLAYGVI